MSLFGKELELIRKKENVTQYNLAKELNISRSHMSRIAKGERNANKELILKISKILKLDNYSLNKLFILAGFEPEFDKKDSNAFKTCFYLSLEFKNKGYIQEAFKLTQFGMNYFDNMIKLNALLANLNLLKRDYDGAINANQEVISLYDKLGKKELKELGITKAEIIHNLGYVYFEKGLDNNKEREKLIVKNWENNDKSIESQIENLNNLILSDFDKAEEKIELASQLEKDNLHIIDQLARLYYHKAEIFNEEKRKELFRKSINFYEKLISYNNENEISKKQDASIFLALSLGKIFELTEASRLINTIICFKPLYYLGYYVKSLIYSINGEKQDENLLIAYNSLKEAINLNPELKEHLINEIDLYNLRFNKSFYDKFIELCSVDN